MPAKRSQSSVGYCRQTKKEHPRFNSPPGKDLPCTSDMCYFAQVRYRCGDWKWGNMVERCPRQHRIGETCGAKLVATENVDPSSDLCRICQEIEVKKRRLQKTMENIARWAPQGSQFASSLDKAKAERAQFVEKINELESRRSSSALQPRGDRSARGLAGFENIASNPLSPEGGSSYTYSTHSRVFPASSGYSSANPTPGRQMTPQQPEVRQSYYTPYSMRR